MSPIQTTSPAAPATDDARWAAVSERRPATDFFYAVTTTGVYCRPGCASRRPLRAHVRFFDHADQARAAGFRPCLRCKPDHGGDPSGRAQAVAAACRRIEAAETPPDLKTLAEASGFSPFHFHRLFKAATGLTPAAYARAARDRRLREALPGRATVTEAIYDAGFNASGRFYERSQQALGMAPKTFKDGGARETIRFALGRASLGLVLAAATDRGVCAITLGDDAEALRRDLARRFPKATLVEGGPAFEATLARVVALIEAPGRGLDLPLDIRGAAFQQRVWDALGRIPPGRTASYAEVAAAIGAPKAMRAVAQACAANPLAVAVPCHRVVRADGALSGYRWGVERKRALLEREKNVLTAELSPDEPVHRA